MISGPYLAVLCSGNMLAFSNVKFYSPNLISKICTLSIDFVTLCIVGLDRYSQIIPCTSGSSAIFIGNLDLVSLAGNLDEIFLLATVVRGVVGYIKDTIRNRLRGLGIKLNGKVVAVLFPSLVKLRESGILTLNEIDILVEQNNLSFGMDVTMYNIEPKKKNA